MLRPSKAVGRDAGATDPDRQSTVKAARALFDKGVVRPKELFERPELCQSGSETSYLPTRVAPVRTVEPAVSRWPRVVPGPCEQAAAHIACTRRTAGSDDGSVELTETVVLATPRKPGSTPCGLGLRWAHSMGHRGFTTTWAPTSHLGVVSSRRNYFVLKRTK